MALKNSVAAFSMKVTITPWDCDKVNQILPIMKAHLGPVMKEKTYTALFCWTLWSGGLLTDAEAAEDCAEDLVGGDFAGD